MKNFIINNQAEQVATIDILGDIGEGFFSDGVTMESINDQIRNISAKEIKLNISSLGGNVWHALAIHDMLKMHPAKVTSKIISATASGGTIIAMAGDRIEMSENAVFLIHNTSSHVQGNAKDMREVADELDKVDSILVNIYHKKTKQKKSAILSLMEEEKFLTAKEAKEFGFIDNVFAPVAAAASLNKAIEFYNLKNTEIKIEDVKNLFEEFKSWAKGQFAAKPDESEAINAKVAEFENKIKELEVNQSEQIAELTNKVTEHEAAIAEKDTVITDLNNKVTELTNQIEASKTGGNANQPDGDPAPIIDKKPTTADIEAKAIFNELKKDPKFRATRGIK